MHPPGRDIVYAQYTGGGGTRTDSAAYGRPLAWVWSTRSVEYEDAPRAALARATARSPYAGAVSRPGVLIGGWNVSWVGYRGGWGIATRSGPAGAVRYVNLSLFGLAGSALVLVLVWYGARGAAWSVWRIRGKGAGRERPRTGRIGLAAVLCCGAGLAAWTCLPERIVSARPDLGAWTAGAGSPVYAGAGGMESVRTSLDEERVRALAGSADGEAQIARELLRHIPRQDDGLVLAIALEQETVSTVARTLFGWPATLMEVERIERGFVDAGGAVRPAAWPAGPWKISLRNAELLIAAPRAEGQDHVSALVVYLPALGTLAFALWLLWLMARAACYGRARARFNRRVRQGLCTACGYDLRGLVVGAATALPEGV